MSAHAEPGVREGNRRRRSIVVVAAAIAGVCGFLVVWGPELFSGSGQASRPELQRVLDGLVTGRGRIAPGVTAYVSGPHGTWSGASGLANVKTGEAMRPDAVMHIDSNTKAWTAAVILQLAGEGKLRLDDTVERWLPGALPFGNRITIRGLLNHTSGLLDTNDITADPGAYIGRVEDPVLRAELADLWRRQLADPTVKAPMSLLVRLTAALPLRSTPGTTYHYSNIGYELAGLIAAKAGGAPLGTLFQRRIVEPLGLRSAAYAAQSEPPQPHPRGYTVGPDGKLTDATGGYRLFEGASGGMNANARDEARFLRALMQGKLLRPAQLAEMEIPSSANPAYALGIAIAATCTGNAYQHGGAAFTSKSSVLVSPDGKRVAVVLLNGDTVTDGRTDPRAGAIADAAAQKLYCAA
jgi:D-alanyl-D-alanine carboxypeptidase